MPGSIVNLPLKLSLRVTRRALNAARDAADLGLAAIELITDALGEDERYEATAPRPTGGAFADDDFPVDDFPAEDFSPDAFPVDSIVDPEPHLTTELELVEELAEPGAEDGAGAALRVAAPFPGYDALRAPDVIARLQAADAAELAAVELYERTHRARRTVLSAIEREQRRR